MTGSLDDKVAMVTGGSRGIGAAIAVRLASEGADVAYTQTRAPEEVEPTRDAIERLGRRALCVQADHGIPADSEAAVQQVVDHFGRIDILVNVAGVFVTGSIDDPDRDQPSFDRQLAINLGGVVSTTRAAVPALSDGGRIVSIATAGAHATRTPAAGLADYMASKSAVVAYSKGWARDLGHRRITVNVVQPGPIESDMVPAGSELAENMAALTILGRIGTTQDVAAAVAYLVGPEAGFVTATSLTVDGGLQAL
ncbi:SDR family oxidoreductase [Mycobacterium yunnanensis]|uniref:SDR family oxidoreductase n=1 Tax=Mycobacterium yunnanensis TaxID=368477 RepID=A0A9X3C0B6_9MYCO|nr:SDR family oxidoreductase [Mycobacterium yunnanensis]MCV7420518.1 SDR family oxidoreductase [Mycobacterium yunnanensis]